VDINDFGFNITSYKIDPDGIKRIVGKRGSSTFKLYHIEVFDKNNNSTLKIGNDGYFPFEVNLEPSERIVGIAAYISSDKELYDF
jgi:hypothetical protein